MFITCSFILMKIKLTWVHEYSIWKKGTQQLGSVYEYMSAYEPSVD